MTLFVHNANLCTSATSTAYESIRCCRQQWIMVCLVHSEASHNTLIPLAAPNKITPPPPPTTTSTTSTTTTTMPHLSAQEPRRHFHGELLTVRATKISCTSYHMEILTKAFWRSICAAHIMRIRISLQHIRGRLGIA